MQESLACLFVFGQVAVKHSEKLQNAFFTASVYQTGVIDDEIRINLEAKKIDIKDFNRIQFLSRLQLIKKIILWISNFSISGKRNVDADVQTMAKSKAIFTLALVVIAAAHEKSKDSVQWDEDDPRWNNIPNWWDEASFVPPSGPIEEKSREFWMNHGQDLLNEKLSQKQNMNKAKNLVIFIGDGMGLSTQMATRAYMGNVRKQLSFEKFPYSGLSKTYCINYKVPDSGCTATAILTGIKNNHGTLNVDGNVNLRECEAQQNSSTHIDSIFKYAQDAGKSTGFVTTTRITHATPAAVYATSSSRYWESNESAPTECADIAYQLIHGEVGSKLKVALGGGRRHFLPNINSPNIESGWRTDYRNLINEYLLIQRLQNISALYVSNRVS